MFVVDNFILITGVLLLIGIVSSKLSARFGVPVLVLFLLLGMLAGSEGIGGLEFENYPLAHGIGTLALALILFDGGLSTPLAAIRSAWKPSLLLATMGVLITAVITGIAASWVLQITLLQGLLLGSIVGSTDAAAVFSILRSGGTGLPKRINAILEIESGSNDPMAIFLTIGCIDLLAQPLTGWTSLVGLFLSQMILGSVFGVTMGYAGAWMVNRIELSAPGLYPVLVSTFCLLTYGLTAQFGGSGFLAVYLAGVVMGNQRLVFRNGILLYHDAVAWFSQIVMFVILGLLSFPSRLWEISGQALLIGVVLILVARPLAVIISLLPFRMRWRELTFLSWVGLKGAVPITLATFPLMMGTPQAPLVFDVVFFIVVMSALVQGCTLPMVAKWLGLSTPPVAAPSVTLEISSLRHVDGEVVEYSVDDNSRAAGRKVRELALPEGVVIAMVVRGHQIIPPQGRTEVCAGDHVIAVLRPGTRPLVDQIFGSADDDSDAIPLSIEFPLRGATTVGEMNQFYGIELDGPAGATLDEVLRRRVDRTKPVMNQAIRCGPLMLRVRAIDEEGAIEMVGMTVLSEQDIARFERESHQKQKQKTITTAPPKVDS
jgi:potassium/hydrogen antiporter